MIGMVAMETNRLPAATRRKAADSRAEQLSRIECAQPDQKNYVERGHRAEGLETPTLALHRETIEGHPVGCGCGGNCYARGTGENMYQLRLWYGRWKSREK